jgi:hypothetical protein
MSSVWTGKYLSSCGIEALELIRVRIPISNLWRHGTQEKMIKAMYDVGRQQYFIIDSPDMDAIVLRHSGVWEYWQLWRACAVQDFSPKEVERISRLFVIRSLPQPPRALYR